MILENIRKIERNLFALFFFPFLISSIFACAFFTTSAFADFDQPTDGIRQESERTLFYLSTDNLKDFQSLTNWIYDGKSYIWLQANKDKISYFFNTPNLQQMIYNSMQRVNGGGWVGNPTPQDDNTSKNPEDWVTAERKYGWDLPDYFYLGEMPAPSLRMTYLDNPYDIYLTLKSTTLTMSATFASNFVLNFFGQKGVNAELIKLAPSDVKAITYNLSDYTSPSARENEEVWSWLEKNWKLLEDKALDIKVEGESLFKKGRIVKEGEVVGKDVSGKELAYRLSDTAGRLYPVALSAAITWLNKTEKVEEPFAGLERHMPYDIDTMDQASKNYIVHADPRVQAFKGGATLTFLGIPSLIGKLFFHAIQKGILDISKWFCAAAAFFDCLCSFDILKSRGLDGFLHWTDNLAQIFATLIALALLVFIAKQTFLLLKTGGHGQLKKIAGVCIVGIIAIGLALNPYNVNNLIVEASNKAIRISDSIVTKNETFSKLYTPDATATQKNTLLYWALYHNSWSNWATETSLFDKSNDFAPDGSNEYSKYKNPATLASDKSVPLWSVVLLEELKNNNTNAALRTIDHYIAPKVTSLEYPQFSVEPNPNNKGVPFSGFPIFSLLLMIVVLGLAILKFLSFGEVFVEMFLLYVNVATGILEENGAVKKTLFSLAKTVGRVMVYGAAISFICYISFLYSGLASNIITILIAAGFAFLVRFIIKNPNSFLSPSFVQLFQKGFSKIKDIARVGKENRGYVNEATELKSKIKKDFKETKKKRKQMKKD